MTARITRATGAPPYCPPRHEGVVAYRLQGHEAGHTENFWIGLSVYEPGGTATTAPAGQETVYVVLDGELILEADGQTTVLRRHDSVHLAKGTVRSVHNRGDKPATLLVAIAMPPADTGGRR
jgi:quercetin dioxygenase-like cupin family protein